MTNRSTLIKKLMQTYIVKVSGRILNISTVHLHGIWHLIWRYLSKPVLGGHPVLSGRYSIPEGIRLIQVSLYLQADDMTVYNDELENRTLIGYCRKEKRKTGLVFLLISFIRIMFKIFLSRVKKNWFQCTGLFTCCSYGKALLHYTCK